MNPLAEQTFIRWKPGGLFNKIIAPLTSQKIKGVIWYQGESNANEPVGYEEAFSAMIRNWRGAWDQDEEFPFLYVQLANFMGETEELVEGNWAALRHEQFRALSVPNTGMAVAIDLSEWNDIHPLNKKDVGHRLALLPRKLIYYETDIIAKSAEFHENQVIVTFTSESGRLTNTYGKQTKHIAISNDGIDYYWAEAEIIGNRIKVWNNDVPNPAYIRYTWSDNPASANLVSEFGFPVSPFEMRK